MTLVEKIVSTLKLPNIAKKKHGNTVEISSTELIEAILMLDTVEKVAEYFNVGYNTIHRVIAKLLVPYFGANVQGGHQTWKYILLLEVEHKECHDCKTIKPLASFGKDKYTSHGHTTMCRSCRVKDNAFLYGRRKLRVPPWHSLERDAIAKFYDNCPEGYEVDHIIPLQGFFVSGLHVLSNLQYLTVAENRAKGNEYYPDGETGKLN